MSETRKTTTIRCPGCDKFIDEAFYPQHIESGHSLHVIEIKGLDPIITVGSSKDKGWMSTMMDLPYGGRIRRDFFLIWSLLLLLLGVLLGARVI